MASANRKPSQLVSVLAMVLATGALAMASTAGAAAIVAAAARL